MNPQTMEILNEISTWLQLIVLVASVVTLAITVGKTAQKPNRTQDSRLDALEEWRAQVETRLQTGNDHFDRIDKGNTVTQKAILALIEHALNGNDVNALRDAKKELNEYLMENGNR